MQALQRERVISLIRTLREQRSPDELLTSIFMDIAFHLTSAMQAQGLVTVQNSHQLLGQLRESFIQVSHQPGLRHINVCDGSQIFQTRTAPVESAYLWQLTGRYAGETLVTNLDEEAEGAARMAPWLTASDSYWHIMVLDWLFRHLSGWLASAGIQDAEVLARRLAKRASQDIPDATPLILTVLTDAAGLPRDLLAYVLTRELRQPPQVPFWFQEGLTANWTIRHQWPGRSARLLALAIYAKEKNGSVSLAPHHVRDNLIESGLTRGAWAHLQRFPSSLILHIAIVLASIEAESSRRAFLEELSYWLSRLGNRHQYYTIRREQLLAALVWLPYETSRLRVPAADRRSTPDLFPRELSLASVIIHRVAVRADQYPKLRHVLFALAEHILLLHDRSAADVIAEFSDMLDWFADEADELPARWFKQPYHGLQQRSERWHHAQLEQQRLFAQQLQAQQQADEAAQQAREREFQANLSRVSWPSPVTEFEHSGLTFLCLLNHEQLQLEGAEMGHCVGSYTRQCFAGSSLIFSVRIDDVRIGTLEMHKDTAGRWRPLQFKGKRNRNLMDLIRPKGVHHKAFEHFSQTINRSAG